MTSMSQSRRPIAGLFRLAVTALALAAMACGSSGESPVDGSSADGGCPGLINYPNPGCGAGAAPVCSTTQVLDACAAIILYCGCDGKTVMGGCGWSSQPYLHKGPCGDGGVADGI